MSEENLSWETNDPDLHSEKELETAVIETALAILVRHQLPHFHVTSFGLDCAFWVGNELTQWTKFLEVKVFTKRNGRCAIGSRLGGRQIDLLFDDRLGGHRGGSELRLTLPNVRWILGDLKKPRGSARYALIDSFEAQSAASGGAIRRGKHNNFRHSYFLNHWKSWHELTVELEHFLLDSNVRPEINADES